MSEELNQIRQELVFQLSGGNAHAKLEEILSDFALHLRGVVPEGLPYSAWQLLEHIRIAQEDMLNFSSNHEGTYKALSWPDDYWPKSPKPPSEHAWEQSARQIHADRAKFIHLISDPNSSLVKPFPWGDGQTLFHEACLIIDH